MSGGPNISLTPEQWKKFREREAAAGAARKDATVASKEAEKASMTPEQRYNSINAPLGKTFEEAEQLSNANNSATNDSAFQIKESEEMKKQAAAQEAAQRAQEEQASQQQQAARAQQNQFISQLQEQAAGSSDTLAQKALREASARSQAQREAIQASQSTTTAAGLRGARRADDAATAQTGQQSEQLRIQEQLAARQQLANALQSQRGLDLGQQQFADKTQADQLSQQLALRQAQQQAAVQGQVLDVEERLANQGIQLQTDIANQLASAQRREATQAGLGSLAGAGLGFALGGPLGASLGAGLGGQATSILFNKGGQVKEPKQKNVKIQVPKKMDKDAKFGFKKALESNTEGGKNYAQGGETIRFTGDNPPQLSPDAKRAKAFEIEGLEGLVAKSKAQQTKQAAKSKSAAGQEQATRSQQSALLEQALSSTRGQGPSLASAALKSQSEKSLADQMRAAQSGKRSVAPAALQQALLQSQQQQAGNIAQQAAQLASQEQAQAQGLGLGIGQQMQSSDLQAAQFAQQLADAQLAQQAGIAQAQQAGRAAQESLRVDELAAIKAMEAQKAAANAQSGGGGLFSALGLNEGGVVPGKAEKKGDHIENDTIPAMLSPGEIVIPRTVVEKGEKAMVGFIKGLQEMSKGGKVKKSKPKKQNYANGGITPQFESFEDQQNAMAELEQIGIEQNSAPAISAEQAQLGGAIAQGALGILGAKEAAERQRADMERRQAAADFNRALSRIRGRRNFAHGGMVGYGSVLEAKRQLAKNNKK